MKTYFKKMEAMGFLPKFINIYFYRMSNLGFSEKKSFEILEEEVKKNTKKQTFTNIYDVIENVKKLAL